MFELRPEDGKNKYVRKEDEPVGYNPLYAIAIGLFFGLVIITILMIVFGPEKFFYVMSDLTGHVDKIILGSP